MPIAVGYVFAHYLTLLVEYGQNVLVQLSDPLTRGDDYLGTASLVVQYPLSAHPSAAGRDQGRVHHHRATCSPSSPRTTGPYGCCRPGTRSVGQLAMLLVMVGYTVGGLLLLFNA